MPSIETIEDAVVSSQQSLKNVRRFMADIFYENLPRIHMPQ